MPKTKSAVTPTVSQNAAASASSPATPGGGAAGAPAGDLVDAPLAQLQAASTQAMGDVASIRAALPNPTRLTTTERKGIGRLKNGESAMLQIVADVAAMPAYAPLVASLADSDYGDDPAVFEAALLKERLQRVDALSPVATALESLAQDIDDTVLDLQRLASEPLRMAYRILKAVSASDPTLRAKLADPINFYAAIAQTAVKTRKAKKAAAAATATPAAAATAAPAAATRPTVKG